MPMTRASPKKFASPNADATRTVDVSPRSAAESGTLRKVAIFRNPRSHGNRGHVPAPIARDRWPDIQIVAVEPGSRSEIPEVLEELAAQRIDALIINGGDGTVRDILTAGMPIFGKDWPRLAVLPRGKTNALTVDLGVPDDWGIDDALKALENGTKCERSPMVVTSSNGSEDLVAAGFILGAGAFTMGTQAAQDAHRYGAFGGLAVGLTVGWSVVQILFGRAGNRWRQGVPMRMRMLPQGEDLPYRGTDVRHSRAVLVATSLTTFPLGLKPFGPERPGLKYMAIDRPRRRIFFSAPAIIAGRQYDYLHRLGLHQGDAKGFEIDLGGEFILDGEAYPAGSYRIETGPRIAFAVP